MNERSFLIIICHAFGGFFYICVGLSIAAHFEAIIPKFKGSYFEFGILLFAGIACQILGYLGEKDRPVKLTYRK